MSRNFVIRLTSWQHHNDVTFTKFPASTSLCVVMNATFKIKHSKLKGMQEK